MDRSTDKNKDDSQQANIETKLHHVAEHVKDVLWACDAKLNITYVSPSMERTSGFTSNERIGLPVDQNMTPVSVKIFNRIVTEHLSKDKKATNNDQPIKCQLEAYRKDGSKYPVEISISLVRNDAGEITGLVGSNRDITERNHAAAIIKAIHKGAFLVTGQEYLKKLVYQLGGALNMRYAFIAILKNHHAQTLAFYNGGELGANFSYLLNGSPCENVIDGSSCYYSNDVAALFPRDKNLQSMGIESYFGTPVFSVTGNILGLLVLMDDKPREDIPFLEQVLQECADRTGAEISRVQAELNLAESEEKFRALFEQSIDPCVTCDRFGNIIYANESMLKTFGYSEEELNSTNALELIPNTTEAREKNKKAVAEIFSTGQARYEGWLIKKLGDLFPSELTGKLININGEKVIQGVIRDLSGQYRAQAQEKAAQQQLQNLFSGLQTLIAVINTSGQVTFTNTNTTPLTKLIKRDDIKLGRKLWDYRVFNYSVETQALVKSDIDKAVKGSHTHRDLKILTSKNCLKWIQLSIHPITDEQGEIKQLVVEGSDIDQRKRLEQQLLAAEERRKAFRIQAPMAVLEWDITTNTITEWNAAAEKMFGFDFNDVKDKGPDFLTQEGAYIDKQKIINSLTFGKEQTRIISKNRTKNGDTIRCEWYNSPIIGKSGDVIGAMSIVRDITAERRNQQLLLNREAEQREILDSIFDAVLTIDETGKVTTFNKAAEELFGYYAEEIISHSSLRLVPENHLTELRQFLKRYLETNDPKYLGVSNEVEGLRKDKTTFPARIAAAALSESREGKHRFIVSVQDITRFKEHEEQLRRTQKMDALGNLTGGIAHDFNNMLGVITGYADLLQTNLARQPKLEKYAREIVRAGDRGSQLTEKLLGFSAHNMSTAEVLNINAQLQVQEHMLKKSLTPRIKLELDLDEQLWPVYLNGGDFEDAVLNISINARHAMPEGGVLRIHTSNVQTNNADTIDKGLPTGDYVLLRITDNGDGMDEKTRERIFDPFFSTKGDQGTGLGLSQVYGFIERSKGQIKTRSKPGSGTEFSLFFPKHHSDVSERIETASQEPTQTVFDGKKTILVVDDEEALLSLLDEVFSQQGYHVIPVDSGRKALEILKTTPVDLLFSDVIMPELDGYQLAAKVQSHYPNVKIQLASGFTDDRIPSKTNVNLAHSIIQKPFNIQELLAKIHHLLEEALG